MKLRLQTSLLWLGREYHHGDEVEMPDDVAARFVATHQAEPIIGTIPLPKPPLAEAMARDTSKQATTMRQHQPQLRRR